MSSDESNCGPMDLISELPSNIVQKIHKFMPIRDAVRTSILSTNWRYKWTSLPQLMFDKEFFNHLRLKQTNHVANIIKEILFLHDGPIRKFSICEPFFFDKYIHELGHWLLFLSRVGVKKIILYNIFISRNPTKLPSSFFSCQELTYLDLRNFIFEPPRLFRGFKHLTTLVLHSVVISSDVFERLVSSALQLRLLTCINCPGVDTISFQAPNLIIMALFGHFKSISISQCPYLSLVSINLAKPSNDYIHDRSISLVKIIDHWPRLMELVIGYHALKVFATVNLPEGIPARFNHLEHLHFDHTYFQDVDQFSSALFLIRSSPNLQKLDISSPSFDNGAIQPVAKFIKQMDSTECTLDRLRIVRMVYISGSSPELELLKFLLSSTPVLETMIVKTSNKIDPQAEVNLTRKLMQFRRVSPNAEIIYKANRKKI